jgi:DNA-binding MarR family transcriptional regulator
MSGHHGDDDRLPHEMDAERVSTLLVAIRGSLRRRQLQQAREFAIKVTPQEFRLLQAVYEAEQQTESGLSISEIGRRLGVSHTTVSPRVAGLERQGLVTRSSHPDHRLAALIRVSALAREWLVLEQEGSRSDPLVAALERASARQRQVVVAGLETLAELLRLK